MSASRRSARARFPLAKVGAIAVAALVGALIGRATSSGGDAHEATTPKPTVAPTRQGAVLAAIGYLDALDWDVLVDDARRWRVIADVATLRAVRRLDAALAVPAQALRGVVTQPPIVARTAVLGYRATGIERRRIKVRVWGMSLFATAAYGPATQWSTSDVSLVWSGKRWLVDAVQSRGGPSPDSPLRVLARSDRALQEVRNVP